jgi:hypothetical protein
LAQAWQEHRRFGRALIAAITPITLIGLGLMLYNDLRFDSPFEFGLRYALSRDRLGTSQPFSLRYLWYHFRVYVLEPARWDARFPYVHDIIVPPPPTGHGRVEHVFGILTNIPIVWLTLAVPLAWRGRPIQTCSALGGFLAAVAFLFTTCALTLSLFFSASIRYEVEFLPALVLLAVTGVLSLERAFHDRPHWRWAARGGWVLLLGFSLTFTLLASAIRRAESLHNLGYIFDCQGRTPEAITKYEHALRLNPDWTEPRNNLGIALAREGKLAEAVEQFRQALRIDSHSAALHKNIAVLLVQLGELSQAMEHFEQALRLDPDNAQFHYEYAVALERAGRGQEATLQFEQARRLKAGLGGDQNRLDRPGTAR